MLGDAGGNDTYIGSSSGLCNLQALLLSYFGLASMMWSVSIAFTLHMAFLRDAPGWSSNEVHLKNRKYQVLCFGLPCVLTLLPLFSSSYGDTGGWCWIHDDDSISIVWRFLQFYIPLWAAISYNIFVYTKVHRKIKAIQQLDPSSNTTMMSRMKYYPLVLIICFTPGTINILFELSGKSSFGLNILHAIFAASQGMMNAVVYGLTPAVYERVSETCVFRTCCAPCIHKIQETRRSGLYNKAPLNDDRDIEVDLHLESPFDGNESDDDLREVAV